MSADVRSPHLPHLPAAGRPPHVTVFVVTYRQAEYIAQSLASLFAQSYRDFELIVVDDCSPDDTVARARRLVEGTGARVIAHSSNVGQYRTYNQLLELARGELLLFASGDDVCAPNLLERLVAALGDDPRVGLAFSNVLLIDERGRALGDLVARDPARTWLGRDWRHDGKEELPRLLEENYVVCIGSVLLRKSAFAAVGGFAEGLPQAADWDLWLRLAAQYRLAYVAEPLLAWRQHGDTVTSRLRRSGQYYEDNVAVLERALGELPPGVDLPPARQARLRARAHLAAGFADLASGRVERAYEHSRVAHDRDAAAATDLAELQSLLLQHGVSLLSPELSPEGVAAFVDQAIADLPAQPLGWSEARRPFLALAHCSLAQEARRLGRADQTRGHLLAAARAWPGAVATRTWWRGLPGALPYGRQLVALCRGLRPRRPSGSLARALDTSSASR